MRLIGVSKQYGELAALKDVDLTVEEGKITAVLGESGAGKTTLLSVIAGLIPYAGRVEGAGRTSYLFQQPKLLPHLSAEENLKFVLPKSEWGKIGEMLARVGLGGRERARARTLSGGEAQRVAIARAFLYPHESLLMDEPFSSLDLALKKSLIELVTELHERAKNTVIFVTHDVHEAVLLSSRAVVLKKGRIVCDLKIEERPRDFFTSCGEERLLTEVLMNG